MSSPNGDTSNGGQASADGGWPAPWPMTPPSTSSKQPFTPPHDYAAVSSASSSSPDSSASSSSPLKKSRGGRAAGWFWQPHSPNFRFFILALATLVPFGGHVIKYSISSLQHEMLADAEFDLNHTQMGMFQSAVSVPNLFMPIVGGLLLDHRGNAKGTILMLIICLVGHLGFVLACSLKSFQWALVSRILFGLGQGSTVVAQGRICATWFVGREIVFAVALTESTHNLANFIAFVYVVPVSEWMGGYIWSLWLGVGFCVMSLIAGIIFFRVNRDAEPDEEQMEATETDGLIENGSDGGGYNSLAASPTSSVGSDVVAEPSSCLGLGGLSRVLSLGFLLLCVIHMTYSNCYHLFAYVSATLISDRFHTTVAKAGWLAGLSNGIAIFLCPLAGLFMDWAGYKMWILVFCGLLSTVSYLLLLSASVTPVPSLILLAVVVSFTPTILKSAVPNLVTPGVYGLAYGVYVISESVGSVLGNGVVGFIRDTTHSWDTDIEIFACMAFGATALTVVLIALDHYECLGTAASGRPLGGLNQASQPTVRDYDRLKKRKDRYLAREHRKWRRQEEGEARSDAAVEAEESGEVVATIGQFKQ